MPASWQVISLKPSLRKLPVLNSPDLGCTVVIAARGQERLAAVSKELSIGNRKVDYVACNIRQEDEVTGCPISAPLHAHGDSSFLTPCQVKKLMAETLKRHGSIDFLVNNAGLVNTPVAC